MVDTFPQNTTNIKGLAVWLKDIIIYLLNFKLNVINNTRNEKQSINPNINLLCVFYW